MKRKYPGFPKDFDPDKPDEPRPKAVKQAKVKKPIDVVMQAKPKPNTSRKVRIRNPLQRRPPEAKIKKFLEAGKAAGWKPGVSGNPAGMKKGTKITDYRAFVEACRKMSPRALARLREALELPWSKQTARTILSASALVLERSWGRAVAVTIDATPDRTAPVIPLDEEYWANMSAALRESGALTKPLEATHEKDVVDAEVVVEEAGATKLIEPPRPSPKWG